MTNRAAIDLTEPAEHLARNHGAQGNVSHGTWVEFAVATHGGYCPDDPTQRTGPTWDLVERAAITGGTGAGRCGGCGGLGRGWVHTGARDLGAVDDPGAAMAAMLAGLVHEASTVTLARAEQTSARLRWQLAEALERLADGEDDDDVTTGSETRPGVYRERWGDTGGAWLAWDYDPTDARDPDGGHGGGAITVYAEDLGTVGTLDTYPLDVI